MKNTTSMKIRDMIKDFKGFKNPLEDAEIEYIGLERYDEYELYVMLQTDKINLTSYIKELTRRNESENRENAK